MTVDLDTPTGMCLTFESVQTLHHLEDVTLSLSGHCKSAKAALETIGSIPGINAFTDSWSIGPLLNRLNGYSENIPALIARINNSIGLVIISALKK